MPSAPRKHPPKATKLPSKQASAPQVLSRAKVPIQLKVDAEIARQFRVFCAERELDLSEAFLRMFETYRNISSGR